MTQTHYFVAALVMASVLGCSSKPQRHHAIPLDIDHAWDRDFAKSGCEMVRENGTPCINDPEAMVNQVEFRLESALEQNPNCSGVTVRPPLSLNGDQVYWSLYVDIDLTGGELHAATSEWRMNLVPTDTTNVTVGDLGDYYSAAGRICAVIKGQGASERKP